MSSFLVALLVTLASILSPSILSAQPDSIRIPAEHEQRRPIQDHEIGQLLLGYSYDGTHGPRVGLGLCVFPNYGHFSGFAGYGFTGTVDLLLGGENPVVRPALGVYCWLLLIHLGAEVGVGFDGERSYLLPRFLFGAGIGGGHLAMTIAVAPERPMGMGAVGAQFEYPIAELW